jgi:signal transduction histidine kinase/DNA-binding response OmpR family regulator
MCNKEILWFWNGKGCYYQCMLKNQTWTRFPVSGSTTVPIDSGGNLWLPDGTTLRSFPLPGKQQAVHWTTFHLEPGKAVWFRVNGEPDVARLVLYDLKNGSLKTIFSPQNNENLIGYIRAQPYYSRSYMNEEGTIWLTGFPGLTKIRYTSTLFQHFLSKPVEHIEAPPSGRSIRDLAEDAAGNVYVRDAEFNLYKTGTASGVMDKINPPLVSAGNNGMHPDAEFRALQKSRPDLANRVSSVINDPDGYVWFAAPSRLFRYDPVTGQLRHFQVPTSVEVTLFSEDNEIWWITNPESYSVNKRTGALRPLTGLRREHFEYGTMLPKDHTLWGFNDTGLIKVNTRNLDTRYIRLYNEPREQRCLVSHRGWLWVGTSRGLERVDPNTFAHTNFDRSKGLPGNFVYSMVADGDYLWLGTSDGLCRFNVETGATKNFYVEDGLSHNEFNSLSVLKTRNGRIYMGGLNGINAFFPADLEAKTTFKSRILLSKYSLFDTYKDSLVLFNVSTLPEELELPPSVTSLNLHLALTSYLDPAKNQYAWRMDGLDNDWYYAGNQHVASYHHLSPGSYTFRAKAADSFGNWSENELVIRITVLRPWYSRWWAWLAYVFLAGATIFALYRNQLSKRMEHAERLRLQELDSFKNRFFTNITHEFRTPLTVILGMSERLENDGVTSSHPVTLIKRNGQNLLRLINQILDLAKLESHALQIHNIQGDVLPYLRDITESLQSLANAQNVLLRVESKEDELLMDYDPERLLQIVHNLLSNAIKFTPSGGQVVLNIGRVSNPADVLTITVADTGAGIPPGDLPNIFDRFYQANNLEKAKAGGTGIGLSLTMELVKAMGGTITVDSEVGKGAIFTVQLPIANRSERLEARSEKIGIVETDDAFKSKAAHVAISHDLTFRPSLLMIEDNPDVVEYLIACLGENYRLDYAYNGLSGIEKALETVPDLIVSDVMMPEKDGFEVCETLKNDERTSHIPIVLLTARADAASRIAGLRRGADAYLSKPFNKEELLAQLQVLAEKQRRMTAWLSKKMQNEQPLQLPEAVAEADILLEDAFIQKVRDIVAKNYTDEDFGLPQLCREIGMSRSQLFRKMSALIDTSPSDFIRSHRLNEAKKLLETTDLNVSEVAWQCGFVNLAHFSRIFQEEFGVLPSATGK